MEKSKAMAPMTKEEWEKKQSVVRKVLDEESGRYRLFYHSVFFYLNKKRNSALSQGTLQTYMKQTQRIPKLRTTILTITHMAFEPIMHSAVEKRQH